MRAILLSPHNDDAELFAAYTCLREKPVVAVCFQSVKQEAIGIYHSDREAETSEAMSVLGCEWEQWLYPDDQDDPGALFTQDIRDAADTFDHCYAPKFEPHGGVHHHNLVSLLAGGIFGPGRVTFYCTYRRGEGRTCGTPVPYEPHWPGLKMKALACYQSQINLPATQPWFECDWIEEFVA